MFLLPHKNIMKAGKIMVKKLLASAVLLLLSVQSAELKRYKSHREIIEALGSLEYVSFIEEISS